MRRLLVLALLIPAPVFAQDIAPVPRPDPYGVGSRRGLTFAVTGFTGGDWQPSGVDVGLLRAVGGGHTNWIAANVRVGSFVQDQSVLYGRTTGFFVAAIASARTSLATLATVGADRTPSFVRLIGMVEAGAEFNARSPLPQGGSMLLGSALVGFAFGGGPGRVEDSFALLLGPAGFFGKATNWHMQVSLRYQTPLRGR